MVVRTCVRKAFSDRCSERHESVAPVVQHCRSGQGTDGWHLCGQLPAWTPAGSVTRLDLDLPAGVELVSVYPPAMVLSPDGARVAFVGVFRGLRQLYMRRLDQFETIAIRGTENANAVFMSPDGRALGFITADLALKRVSLADGLVTTVEHDAEFSAGAAWGADDRITFVRAGALWQVPASGGPAKHLTTLDSGKQELLHAWPSVIAQGRILLFGYVLDRRGRQRSS
jgi:hypothetical protein